MSTPNPNPNFRLKAEDYLATKNVKRLLEKMIVSMLDKRPENVEIYMVQWLLTQIPPEISPFEPQNAYKQFPPKSSETEQKSAKRSFPARAFPQRNQSSPLAAPSPFPGQMPGSNLEPPSSIAASYGAGKPSVTFGQLPEQQKRGSQSMIRRKSEINPNLFQKVNRGQGRNPILPTLSSNTTVEIKDIPKEKETFDKLVNIFKNVGLFSFLNDEQRSQIVASMDLKSFNAGDVIIKQGDQPDYFYIFEQGTCSVLKNIDGTETFICKIQSGGYAGELGMISGRQRAATIIADTDVTAWAMDKKTYWVLLRDGHIKKRETYTEILSRIELLKILDKSQIWLIVDALHPVEYPEGTEIIKQGDEGESFYMIIEGECGVSKPLSGNSDEIAVIKAGGYFGERALLLNEQRAATVTAKTFCKCARLDRHTFTRLLKPVIPQLLERIQSFSK